MSRKWAQRGTRVANPQEMDSMDFERIRFLAPALTAVPRGLQLEPARILVDSMLEGLIQQASQGSRCELHIFGDQLGAPCSLSPSHVNKSFSQRNRKKTKKKCPAWDMYRPLWHSAGSDSPPAARGARQRPQTQRFRRFVKAEAKVCVHLRLQLA